MKEKRVFIKPSFLIPLFLLFWGSDVMEILFFLSAVILHEVGHLLAIGRFGYGTQGLSLSLTGAQIRLNSPYVPYRKEILIFLAGPMGNLFGCGIAFLLLRLEFTKEGMFLFFCNALLALFNLLPIRGLDGERALYALICLHTEEERAEKILSAVNGVFLALLLTFSLYLLIKEKNPSLLLLTASLALEKTDEIKKAATDLS